MPANDALLDYRYRVGYAKDTLQDIPVRSIIRSRRITVLLIPTRHRPIQSDVAGPSESTIKSSARS